MSDKPIMGVVHPDPVPREPKSSEPQLSEQDYQQLERAFRAHEMPAFPSGTFWAIKRITVDLDGEHRSSWAAFVVDLNGYLVRPLRMLGDRTTFSVGDDDAAKVNAERDGYESGLPKWSAK
jgi:hypothetical protein